MEPSPRTEAIEQETTERGRNQKAGNSMKVCNTWGGPCNSATALSQPKITDLDFRLKKMYKTEYGVNKKTNEQLRDTLIEIINCEEENSGSIDVEDATVCS